MKKISLIIPLILFSSGCAVHGPSIELEPPIKFGKIHYDGHHKSPQSCPPGLAKQGRC